MTSHLLSEVKYYQYPFSCYELPYLQNLYHWLSESVFPEPPFEVPADQLCLGWYHILKSHHGLDFEAIGLQQDQRIHPEENALIQPLIE